MAYGIQFNTSAGTKDITSVTDVGLRLHYATKVTPSYGSSVVFNPSAGLPPQITGTINVPNFDSSITGARIISFLDESQPWFLGPADTAGNRSAWGTWNSELNLTWNNTTKNLDYALIAEGGPNYSYQNVWWAPYVGTYNIWFLYGG